MLDEIYRTSCAGTYIYYMIEFMEHEDSNNSWKLIVIRPCRARLFLPPEEFLWSIKAPKWPTHLMIITSLKTCILLLLPFKVVKLLCTVGVWRKSLFHYTLSSFDVANFLFSVNFRAKDFPHKSVYSLFMNAFHYCFCIHLFNKTSSVNWLTGSAQGNKRRIIHHLFTLNFWLKPRGVGQP